MHKTNIQFTSNSETNMKHAKLITYHKIIITVFGYHYHFHTVSLFEGFSNQEISIRFHPPRRSVLQTIVASQPSKVMRYLCLRPSYSSYRGVVGNSYILGCLSGKFHHVTSLCILSIDLYVNINQTIQHF